MVVGDGLWLFTGYDEPGLSHAELVRFYPTE